MSYSVGSYMKLTHRERRNWDRDFTTEYIDFIEKAENHTLGLISL